MRNEEPHKTGISLKPTRVISNKKCSMEFSHSSDCNTCSWEIPQKEVGPNGNYHMVLDGMGFQRVPSAVLCLLCRWSQPTMDLDIRHASKPIWIKQHHHH